MGICSPLLCTGALSAITLNLKGWALSAYQFRVETRKWILARRESIYLYLCLFPGP